MSLAGNSNFQDGWRREQSDHFDSVLYGREAKPAKARTVRERHGRRFKQLSSVAVIDRIRCYRGRSPSLEPVNVVG